MKRGRKRGRGLGAGNHPNQVAVHDLTVSSLRPAPGSATVLRTESVGQSSLGVDSQDVQSFAGNGDVSPELVGMGGGRECDAWHALAAANSCAAVGDFQSPAVGDRERELLGELPVALCGNIDVFVVEGDGLAAVFAEGIAANSPGTANEFTPP